MEVVKIVMLGMTGVCLGLLLKETKPEYAVYISLAVGVFIFSYMTEKIAYLFSSILKLREYLPLEEKYLTVLLKMIGVTYLAQFLPASARMQGILPLQGRLKSLPSCILWCCPFLCSWR